MIGEVKPTTSKSFIKQILFLRLLINLLVSYNNKLNYSLSIQMQGLSFCEQYIYKLKVLIMGDKNVGKSTLIYTYLNDHLPKSKLIKQELNFHIKKLHYKKGEKNESQVKYQCRFHLWDVSGSVCNRENVSKFLKQNLFQHTSAYILAFKDEKSYRYIIKNVWPILPKLAIQPVYLIQLESKQFKFEKQLSISQGVLKQIEAFAKKQKIIDMGKLNLDDPQMVYKFFEQIKDSLMYKISDGIVPINHVIIKDRNSKILLKDVNIKENQHFEKRYNRCC